MGDSPYGADIDEDTDEVRVVELGLFGWKGIHAHVRDMSRKSCYVDTHFDPDKGSHAA